MSTFYPPSYLWFVYLFWLILRLILTCLSVTKYKQKLQGVIRKAKRVGKNGITQKNMKKFSFKLVLMVLALSMVFVSCKKDETELSNEATYDGTTLTLKRVSWKPWRLVSNYLFCSQRHYFRPKRIFLFRRKRWACYWFLPSNRSFFWWYLPIDQRIWSR